MFSGNDSKATDLPVRRARRVAAAGALAQLLVLLLRLCEHLLVALLPGLGLPELLDLCHQAVPVLRDEVAHAEHCAVVLAELLVQLDAGPHARAL